MVSYSEKMTKKIKRLMEDLKKDFNENEIIFITYDPYVAIQMREDDITALDYFLKKIEINRAVVILHGSGGLFEVGLVMSYLFRNRLKHYTIFIPSNCCSSLCLLFFKADKLLIDTKSKITQVDPIFEYEGKPFRAIKFLHSKDPDKKEIARKCFHYSRYSLIGMLRNKPSLFDFKNVDFEDFGHTELIVDAFMNKEEHWKEVNYKELKFLDLKVELIKNENIIKKSKELIQECYKLLKKDKKRLILVTTCKIVEGKDKGNLIMID